MMSSNAGRNDPCECGSGKKYKDCCGAPKGEVVDMRAKDLNVFELTPGLADALTASLDTSYMEYLAAACSGRSTKEAERRIAAIPEDKRYLTRVLDSLDSAFADFDSETAMLDLPHMQNRKPAAIKRYLEFRVRQFKMLLDAVGDYVDDKCPTKGGHS
jgi:SEC-C motif